MSDIATSVAGITTLLPISNDQSRVLSREALVFLSELARKYEARRRELLGLRLERRRRIDNGELPDFLPHTR